MKKTRIGYCAIVCLLVLPSGCGGARPNVSVAVASGSSSSVTPGAFESNIAGTFTGWTGDTVFELENGETWQQDGYAYLYHYAYRPKVTIYPSGTGWEMKVEGVDDALPVRRL